MDKYVDDKYAVINKTLMSCMEEGSRIVIPASVNGHMIERIGNGCAINRNVKSVTVSEGIVKIASDALYLPIYENHKLWADQVILPTTLKECEWFDNGQIWRNYAHMQIRRRFSWDEFEQLQRSGILLRDGRRLIGKNYGEEIAFSSDKGDFQTRQGWTTPYYQPDMNGVYAFWEWGADRNFVKYVADKRIEQLIFKNRREAVDDLYSSRAGIFRKALVRIMLKETQEPEFGNICELRNDEALIGYDNDNRLLESVLMVYYGEDDVYQEQEDVVVGFHLENCYMHFPTLKKVVVSGKTYFIYCENYLSSDSRIPFNRILFTDQVYDAEGNSVDPNTARRVSAKYRMISMLM